MNLDIHLTQQQLADLLGLSQQAISQIEVEGVADRDMDLSTWLKAYTKHLREIAAGRAAGGGLDLATERAALARVQRERIEIILAEKRRQLAPVVLITEVLAKAGARVSSILEAIPGQVKRRLPDLPATEIEAIQREIAKARNVCAAIRLEDLDEPLDSDTPDSAVQPAADLE